MEKSSPGACPSILYLNAAFRELALGLPAAFAVVAFKDDVAWSLVRVRTFAALAAEAGVPCSVFPPPPSTQKVQ